MKTAWLALALLALAARAQDKKPEEKKPEQKPEWQSDEYGFQIKKAGKRPKDWEFETNDLAQNSFLRIRHKVVIAMLVNFYYYANPQQQDFKIEDQAKSFDENLAKNPKLKVEKKDKIKMTTGEDAVTWKLSMTDEKTNDEYELRIWLWFSAVNKHLYQIEAVVKKGEWERYGKDIQDIVNTIRTVKKK